MRKITEIWIKQAEADLKAAKHGRNLDMFYIPTRYPNGLGGDLAPTEFYEKEDGETCVSSAELILQTVKSYFGS